MRWNEIINEDYKSKITQHFDDQQLIDNAVMQGSTVEAAVDLEKQQEAEEAAFGVVIGIFTRPLG